jgi:hypothetical protein
MSKVRNVDDYRGAPLRRLAVLNKVEVEDVAQSELARRWTGAGQQ